MEERTDYICVQGIMLDKYELLQSLTQAVSNLKTEIFQEDLQ